MLSNPLHRYSTYNALPSNGMMSNGHLSSNHMHSGLHTLADGSQYALQQLQQHVDIHQNGQVHRSHNNKHRQHPYGPGPGNGRSASSGSSGPIRRRISRACDQCNQLRTKCDGRAPCAHCVGKCPAANCGRLLMIRRVWVGLRIYSGTKEARQGFAQRSGTTSCSRSRQWTKIPQRAIIRWEDFAHRVTQ